MANEEEDKKTGAEETPEEKKGGIKGLLAGLTGKKRLIVLVAPAVIVIGAGAFFFLRSSAPDGAESAQDVQATAEADKGAEAASGDVVKKGGSKEQGEVFELKPFVVNLQDNSGTRYLRLQIGLELKEPVSVERMNSLRPKIRNSLIILLSSKSYRDIGNIQGKYRLRDEIVERINHVMKGDKVKTVYFTEFVVQ